MKILVTGGSGFIGSNFIQHWLETHPKDKILNIDTLTYAANPLNTSEFNKNPNYEFQKIDIRDKNKVNNAMKDKDLVVHFAAESHVDRSIDNPNVFLETNILGTQNLLEAALRNNVKRFHHISTDEVFGALKLKSNTKFDENTPYAPRNPYSASKAASDHLVRAYYITFGLPITITNCSNNYGPKQSPEKFIPRSITNLIQNKTIKIYGDGEYVRDWLFVKDHCTAIEAAIEKGKIGETYLVGGTAKDHSNLEIAEMLIELMGKDKSLIERVEDRAGHDRRYAVDFSKISTELGWKPTVTLKEGLEKTIKWYENNHNYWTETKVKAEDFYNSKNLG